VLAAPIRVTLAAQRRHQSHSTLNEPAAVTPAAAFVVEPIVWTVGGQQQRRLNYWRYQVLTQLFSPAVVAPPPAFIARPLLAWTVARIARRREGFARLTAPPVTAPAVPLAPPLRIALTRLPILRHTPRSHLAPPVVVTPGPNEQQQTILAWLVARGTRLGLLPRAPHSRLPLPPLPSAGRIETALVAVSTSRVLPQPRTAHSRLAPPQTVAAAFVASPLRVTLALRPRTETPRRGPDSRLAPPRVVFPPPTQRQQTITVELAWGTRATVGRRAPHSTLRPPTAITPAVLVRKERFVLALAAVPHRLSLLRRGPHSRLGPPTVIDPFVPPVPPPATAAIGHGGMGFPPDWVRRLLERMAEGGVDSLDDDEVAALMLLGYL
jgi:hypothetical protein